MMMSDTLTHCSGSHYLTLISSVKQRDELLFTQRAWLTGSLHSTNARFTELCTAAADEVRVPEREEAYGTGESVWNRVHELILVSSDWKRSTRVSHCNEFHKWWIIHCNNGYVFEQVICCMEFYIIIIGGC